MAPSQDRFPMTSQSQQIKHLVTDKIQNSQLAWNSEKQQGIFAVGMSQILHGIHL